MSETLNGVPSLDTQLATASISTREDVYELLWRKRTVDLTDENVASGF